MRQQLYPYGGGGGAHGNHVILRPGCGHKPCTDVTSNLLAIELQLDVRIACNGLQQKFQHAEYFTCDPLISQPIFIPSLNGFHHILGGVMVRLLFQLNEN